MEITIAAKQVQMTDGLHAYAVKKVEKLSRFFKTEPTAAVTLSRERDRMTAEVTLKNEGRIFRASSTTKDMYASIDASVSAIEQQIRKHKTRLAKSLREGVLDAPGGASGGAEAQDALDVVRVKRFAMKPMTVEEAILQMDLLNHAFFVFPNQDDSGRFAVVYRRDGGGYGLIEAER